ncbi:hypothetical protein BC939DRAFT_451493 [Gamsiella multidivaricata]|uniref:uncharacterized protein n=1 Tax=Gamsiella multidivaricata TaxID=101098 RepID=UPI002220F3DE|nr:uncharacterized protein BC939DRAFT_451493 [Gamsiella multidivaricata]KAI7823607.1 hypothetical protein BC939DRAFT_451493 [Gamsiella multidivaricata]
MSHTLTPEVLWAQRANLVYLTVNLPDSAPTINLTADKLEITASSDGKEYAVTIEFYQPVEPEVRISSLSSLEPKHIVIWRSIGRALDSKMVSIKE